MHLDKPLELQFMFIGTCATKVTTDMSVEKDRRCIPPQCSTVLGHSLGQNIVRLRQKDKLAHN
jgi:hypothetical protein